MNKKALLSHLVTIMIAVTFIILAFAFAGPIKQIVDNARAQNATAIAQGNYTGMNCDEQISGGQNTSVIATCTVTDLYTPLFVGIVVGLAGIIIGARIIFTQ